MIKVAMLSKWHVHAEGYADALMATGKIEVAAVWDENVERGQAWADKMGCPFYAELDELLAREDIAAVVCCAPTTIHREVLVKAANAGKHIFTEKALCPTVRECLDVKMAIEENGVKFVISFPQRGRPCILFAKKMISEGAFGRITMIRARDAHNGVSGRWLPEYWFDEKDAAGGAMMDLGCHPMYLLAYLLGKPKRVTGLFSSPFGTKVDENAVSIAEFENGALGVAETGFVSERAPQTVEIYGTDGTMIAHGEDVSFWSKKLDGVFGWLVKPELPAAKPIPLIQFAEMLANGSPVPEGLGIDDAIALTELLENAYKANNSGTIIEL